MKRLIKYIFLALLFINLNIMPVFALDFTDPLSYDIFEENYSEYQEEYPYYIVFPYRLENDNTHGDGKWYALFLSKEPIGVGLRNSKYYVPLSTGEIKIINIVIYPDGFIDITIPNSSSIYSVNASDSTIYYSYLSFGSDLERLMDTLTYTTIYSNRTISYYEFSSSSISLVNSDFYTFRELGGGSTNGGGGGGSFGGDGTVDGSGDNSGDDTGDGTDDGSGDNTGDNIIVDPNTKNIFDTIKEWGTHIIEIPKLISNIFEYIKTIPTTIIDGISSLFIPRDNYFEDTSYSVIELWNSKMPNLSIFSDILSNFFNSIMGNNDPPQWYLPIPVELQEYMGTDKALIIDFSWFDDYRDLLHTLLTFFILVSFMLRLPKKLERGV